MCCCSRARVLTLDTNAVPPGGRRARLVGWLLSTPPPPPPPRAVMIVVKWEVSPVRSCVGALKRAWQRMVSASVRNCDMPVRRCRVHKLVCFSHTRTRRRTHTHTHKQQSFELPPNSNIYTRKHAGTHNDNDGDEDDSSCPPGIGDDDDAAAFCIS